MAERGELTCFRAWRSIGSHTFLEYGMPTLVRVRPRTRAARVSAFGEISIAIHADNWELRAGRHLITTSDLIDDDVLARIQREFLHGAGLPRFSLEGEDALILAFGSDLTLTLWRTCCFYEGADIDDELTLYETGFGFDFERGFNRERANPADGAAPN